jgi:hypothetical protein
MPIPAVALVIGSLTIGTAVAGVTAVSNAVSRPETDASYKLPSTALTTVADTMTQAPPPAMIPMNTESMKDFKVSIRGRITNDTDIGAISSLFGGSTVNDFRRGYTKSSVENLVESRTRL